MGCYVISNKDGSYIRKDKATGKYVPVRSCKYAEQWDTLAKANGVLHNSIAKNIRENYQVRYLETGKIVDKGNINAQRKLCSKEITDDNIGQWLSKINAIVDILSGSDVRQHELNTHLSEVDKEIVDVEHYIEFGKFNAYQGWLCFKMLQNLLKQRRKYKDEIQVLNLIKQCKIDKNSMSKLAQNISNIQNKCYSPRAIPELFNFL